MSSPKPTVCLNMIVRNETRVMERLFTSLLGVIDCFCICDTGSTDGTPDAINAFFGKHGIPGKVCELPFRDFATNRTYALEQCRGMADWLLLLDADMVLEVRNPTWLESALRSPAWDAYHVVQGSDHHFYQNVRLVRNLAGLKYVGATHEYLALPDGARLGNCPKDDWFVRDLGDGGSKSDKFQRDVRLLTRELAEDPNNMRACFYLANSYFDQGMYAEALPLYRQRIGMGGWFEERWYSNYRLGFCLYRSGKVSEAIQTWLEGLSLHAERLEGLYEVIKHFCDHSHHQICDTLYRRAEAILKRTDINRESYLFLHNDVYTYRLYQLRTIFSAYLGNKDIGFEVVQILNACHDSSLVSNLLSNMKFYKTRLAPVVQRRTLDRTCDMVCRHQVETVRSSSASLVFWPETKRLLMNTRYVNYAITPEGNYVGWDRVLLSGNQWQWFDPDTLASLEEAGPVDPAVENEGDQPGQTSHFVGLEDVRIFPYKQGVLYLGTTKWRGKIQMMWGEESDVDRPSFPLYSGRRVLTQSVVPNTSCEKNWVFVDRGEQEGDLPQVIYSWSPLRVCAIDPEQSCIRLVLERTDVPGLFAHMRGSTCGCNVGNYERWFLCHIVSYEQPRHYYHVLVVLDHRDMRVLRYTAPFTFEGESIEYSVGLVVRDDHLLVAYSTWDRTTRLVRYDRAAVEAKFVTAN